VVVQVAAAAALGHDAQQALARAQPHNRLIEAVVVLSHQATLCGKNTHSYGETSTDARRVLQG
jgi:hypothetical protein